MSYFRNLIGMSQNLFATWIGVERSFLARIENNTREFHYKNKSFDKFTEMEVKWYQFSENWTPDPSSAMELPEAEVKKRKKRVDNLLWIADTFTKKLALWKEPEVDIPKARAFLKSVEPVETAPGAAFAILSQLDVLDKREFQSLKSRQNLEITLLLAQTEIAYLKTQPDWLPFFPPETGVDS
jgi:hypothetical protein